MIICSPSRITVRSIVCPTSVSKTRKLIRSSGLPIGHAVNSNNQVAAGQGFAQLIDAAANQGRALSRGTSAKRPSRRRRRLGANPSRSWVARSSDSHANAHEGIGVVAFGDQDRHHAVDGIHGNGEADAGVGAGAGADGTVDPNDLAPQVEQRATGIAGVNGRVGLDDPGSE